MDRTGQDRARMRGGRKPVGLTGLSRKEFVGLGLSSAALLSVGAFPLEAQTTGPEIHLKDRKEVKGTGTDDDRAAIQALLDANENATIVADAFDDSGKPLSYGIAPDGNKNGLRIPSNITIRGTGAGNPGVFKRVGQWEAGMVLFRNADYTNGNKNITLKDLVIDGRRGADNEGIPEYDKDNDATGMRFKVNSKGLTDPGEKLADITMTNVELRNFPGIGISVFNGRRIRYTNVRNINSARGGIRFTAHSNDIYLRNVKSLDTGDTAFGFWASNVVLSENEESVAGDLHTITLENCQSRTRKDSQFGAALMLRGARNVVVKGSRSRFGTSKNDVIQLHEERFKTASGRTERFIPKDILITGAELVGGKDNSFQVIADSAERVKIQNSILKEPADNCVAIRPLLDDAGKHTLGVTILDNTLVRPGLKHIRIDARVTGVRQSGNTFVYDDAKAPTISNVEPASGSTVRRRNVYIKAVVKDNSGGSGVGKSGIKVFVDGKSSSFDYFPNSGNLVCPKSLANGRHTVKITAKDLAGNATSRSWYFRVRA